MLIDGHEDDHFWVLEIESISVGLNALLWFVVGMVIGLVVEKLGRGSANVLRPNTSCMDSSRK